jgi:hypothetical protein
MSDSDRPWEALGLTRRKDFGDQAHSDMAAKVQIISNGDDPCRFLATVLQCKESEVRQLRGIGMS